MKRILPATIMTLATFALLSVLAQPVAAQGTFFVEGTSVGIQDATPPTTLHVRETDANKANRTIIRISGSNFFPQFEYKNEATAQTWRLGVNSSNHFVFNEAADLGVAELRVTPAGEVFVNGSQVHPDYVFEPGYELMPLDDLAEFVRDHRHLPKVLNGEERKRQGGIDLASFPVQLLEKIEELALYTIEQHEQIRELQTANQRLTERLEALEGSRR